MLPRYSDVPFHFTLYDFVFAGNIPEVILHKIKNQNKPTKKKQPTRTEMLFKLHMDKLVNY